MHTAPSFRSCKGSSIEALTEVTQKGKASTSSRVRSWPVLCSGSRRRAHYERHLIQASHTHQVGSLAPGCRRRNSFKETKQLLTEAERSASPRPSHSKAHVLSVLRSIKNEQNFSRPRIPFVNAWAWWPSSKGKITMSEIWGRTSFVTLSNNGKANFYLLPFERQTTRVFRSGKLISNLSWIPAILLQRLDAGAIHAHSVLQHKPSCRKLRGFG